MRKTIAVLSLILMSGTMLLPTAAFATKQGEAVELCGKNRFCRIERVKGGVNLTIEGGTGKSSSEVFCPDGGGNCECMICLGRVSGGAISVRDAIRNGKMKLEDSSSGESSDGPSGGTSDGASDPRPRAEEHTDTTGTAVDTGGAGGGIIY